MLALVLHLLADLLAHGAAEQIRLTERETREDLRGLHHLFLIDDDAEGFAQDRFELGMDVIRLLHAVLARAIGRDIRHRTWAIERNQRDDVLEAIRAHIKQRPPHARTFQLEDANGFGAGQKVIRVLVVERDRGQIDVDATPFHERDRGLQRRSAFSGRGNRISPTPPVRPISC